jgi:hypothetical protein
MTQVHHPIIEQFRILAADDSVSSCATALAYGSLGASRRALGALRYAWNAP